MNKKYSLLGPLAFLLIFTLVGGCLHKAIPPAQPTATPAQTTPLARAGDATAQANTKANQDFVDFTSRVDNLHGKLMADIVFSRDANQGNADGPAKTVVDQQLGVAQSRLGAVAPDPQELATAANNKALVEAGKAAEARTAYTAAAKDASTAAANAATARAATVQANKDRDTAIAAQAAAQTAFTAQLEANKQANQKTIDDLVTAQKKALDDARTGILHQAGVWLNIGGAVCMLVLFAGIGFGGLVGAKTVWPFGVFALLCFGMAQIVTLWWFKWAILVSCLIGLGVAIWWVWKHYKLGTLLADVSDKATTATQALHDIVPTLDAAYQTASADTQAWLKANVFGPLGEKMDVDTKNTVTAVRADANLIQPTVATLVPPTS